MRKAFALLAQLAQEISTRVSPRALLPPEPCRFYEKRRRSSVGYANQVFGFLDGLAWSGATTDDSILTVSILELARLLLRQEDDLAVAETLLREILKVTGADRGFVVARDEQQFVPKFEVSIDSNADDEGARFSRGLVRTALERNEPIYSSNPAEDPELSQTASVIAAAGRAVFVVPLSSGEERYGALYLEHPKVGGFSATARAFVLEGAELAGLALHRAVQRAELARRSRALERDLLAQFDFGGIVTRDPAMLHVLTTVAQVANAKASVLVRGESGTGKELVARALHVNSGRSRGPFVALHCAALPSAMLESELFGHVRGAFTGADRDRPGRLASAAGGTLFLDEVGELPGDVQAKLLRAVQFGELQRVGADKVEKVDVRIVAATHRDLAAMVKKGQFREDLYYRLRVIEVVVPPLRERPGDIVPLTRRFLKQLGGRASHLTPEAIRCLELYDWPGNIRELENAMERGSLLSRSDTIGVDALPPEIAALSQGVRDAAPRSGGSTPPASARAHPGADDTEDALDAEPNSGPTSRPTPPPSSRDSIIGIAATEKRTHREELLEFERRRIVNALEQCAGNQTAAAKLLEMSRRTLVSRLATFELTRPRRRS